MAEVMPVDAAVAALTASDVSADTVATLLGHPNPAVRRLAESKAPKAVVPGPSEMPDAAVEAAAAAAATDPPESLPYVPGNGGEPILRFFRYHHLPDALAAVSAPFAELAGRIVTGLPRSPERTVALRKLLESKDAAARAALPAD